VRNLIWIVEEQDRGRDLDEAPPVRHRVTHGRRVEIVQSKLGKKFPEIHG
jgi:hypothetical protein